VRREQQAAHRKRWFGHPFKHDAKRRYRNVPARLMDGRQGDSQERRILRVVKADHAQITRDAHVAFFQTTQQLGRSQIVRTNHRVPAPARAKGTDELDVFRVASLHPIRRQFDSIPHESLARAGDSGLNVLSEMLGISGFKEKVAGLSRSNLVHQGAELAYLLRHDPQFRNVRREHLVAVGKRVRLKHDVEMLAQVLCGELDGFRFRFFVISASPRKVVQSALEGIVPPENIFGTEFGYDASSGEISSILRVPAGYGKVAVLQELEVKQQISPDHTIYIGDGSSDLYAMHHVNSCDGHTIAVSETKSVGRIARRTVLSENALSVLVPIMEDILKWNAQQIRELFTSYGLALQDWDKIRTDWLTFHKPLIHPVMKQVALAH
jgi:phosphoserine phosphatase